VFVNRKITEFRDAQFWRNCLPSFVTELTKTKLDTLEKVNVSD